MTYARKYVSLYNRLVDEASGGETAAHLLAIAEWNGFRVSRSQLARWHREDLLPRPTIRRLGKSHGTESVYPAGTSRQLLTLCEIHRHHTRPADIGWRLWWQDYPVPLARIRSFLLARARWADELRGKLPIADARFVSEAEENRLPSGPLGDIRRRVGRGDFPAVARVVLSVVAGGFDSFEDAEEAEVVEKAFGSRPLGGNIEESLQTVARIFRRGPLEDLVREASDEALVETRDEFRSVLHMFGTFGEAAGPVLGAQGVAFRLFAKAIRVLRPRDEALLLVLWLALRRVPEVRAGFQELMAETKTDWDRGYRAWKVIEELRVEVPAAADVFSSERMRVALRGPKAQEAWNEEIKRVRSENLAEFEAFFDARPEARALGAGFGEEQEPIT